MPIHPMLAYGRQAINDDDIAAVAAVLRSDFLTQGPVVDEFERCFAQRIGVRHAIAVNNATAGLHIAMKVAGIGKGDRVVTSPITFVASANAAAYVGATPDFADIDPVSYTLSPDSLELGWQADTKGVVAVDFAGQVADLERISRVARARGAVVIEDACHATGGAFHDAAGKSRWNVGASPWADMSVFSFHPVKTMTTGEGGMIVTNDERMASQARRLRAHCIERDHAHFVTGDDTPLLSEKGPWFNEMQELGYNYRLTDIQCALGLSQLARLDDFLERRRAIVSAYNSAFADLSWLVTPALRQPLDGRYCSWHLYVAQLDFKALGKTRTEVMAELHTKGIGTQVHYIPVHLQPWYQRAHGYRQGKCPVAEAYYARALSLPLFPSMTDADVQQVIAAVKALVPDSRHI